MHFVGTLGKPIALVAVVEVQCFPVNLLAVTDDPDLSKQSHPGALSMLDPQPCHLAQLEVVHLKLSHVTPHLSRFEIRGWRGILDDLCRTHSPTALRDE
jgi:hypothetical protein